MHPELEMTKLSTHGVVRDILVKNPDRDTDDVVRRAKAKGLTVPDNKIRHAVHNLRNKVRAEVGGTAKVAPAAARETTAPKPAPVEATPTATTPNIDLQGVLANVALVNDIAGICGGIDNARQAAEAVEKCGGLGAFLQQLELVAQIRSSQPK
jgi:hypothetical protein